MSQILDVGDEIENGKGKNYQINNCLVCGKTSVPGDPFMRENNRIVLDWTAETDHSHGTSAYDDAWPSRRGELPM